MNREEIKKILQENEYGYLPPAPKSVRVEVKEMFPRPFAGKAVGEEIILRAETEKGEVTFPFCYYRPVGKEPCKTVVLLNFSPNVPDKYLPAEEIIDRGWAFACIYYRAVTEDNPDFSDANARALRVDEGGMYATGKIMMWAWSAMRVMDYLQTRPEVDKENVAIVGHSRLGKTALVTSAFDERFAFCHSNDSGCGGAALFRLYDEHCERIEAIVRHFYFWFCPNFQKYVGKENDLPFDQDALLSLIAPRTLSVGSAKQDLWANPPAEFACAKKASEAWTAYGKTPLVIEGAPCVGENYHDGDVGYYVREGTHYLSREDWNRTLDFFDTKIAQKKNGGNL